MGNITQFLAYRFFEVLGKQMYKEIKIKCFVFVFWFLFDFCFTALQHILGDLGRGQVP